VHSRWEEFRFGGFVNLSRSDSKYHCIVMQLSRVYFPGEIMPLSPFLAFEKKRRHEAVDLSQQASRLRAAELGRLRHTRRHT